MSYSTDNVTLISHDDVNIIAQHQKGADSPLQRKYELIWAEKLHKKATDCADKII